MGTATMGTVVRLLEPVARGRHLDGGVPRGCPVCVVDDEPGVRELLSTLCESAGLAAEAYDSAESFLSAYRCEPIRARCLVLDFCLPGMSGLDLLKELNAQGVRLPVLLMSGRAESATVVQGLKLGIVDFFPKPFEVEALLGRILELTGHQHRHRSSFQPLYRSSFQPLSSDY